MIDTARNRTVKKTLHVKGICTVRYFHIHHKPCMITHYLDGYDPPYPLDGHRCPYWFRYHSCSLRRFPAGPRGTESSWTASLRPYSCQIQHIPVKWKALVLPIKPTSEKLLAHTIRRRDKFLRVFHLGHTIVYNTKFSSALTKQGIWWNAFYLKHISLYRRTNDIPLEVNQ